MLAVLFVVSLAQAGLPPNPDALPPSASRMVLDDMKAKTKPPSRAQRQAEAISKHLLSIARDRRDLKLSRDELNLVGAAGGAAYLAALKDDKASYDQLAAAWEKMRAGVSKSVLKAIGDVELPKPEPKPPEPTGRQKRFSLSAPAPAPRSS